jgi:hypothetical protein
VVLIGCAGTPRGVIVPSIEGPSAISSARDAVDGGATEWVLGREGATVVAGAPARAGRVTLADGCVLELEPYVLRVRPQATGTAPAPTSVAARMGWWLGVSTWGRGGVWEAEAGSGAGEAGRGAPVLRVRAVSGIPAGGTSTGKLADGVTVLVHWLEAPAGQAPAGVTARVLSEEAMESAWVRGALATLDASPLTRWRARLARGELFAEGVAGSFDAEVVETLARGLEAQWRTGLTRLALRDQNAARRVAQQLCLTTDFGGGIIVPAWEPEGSSLDSLLERLLLAPDTDALVQGALAWIDEHPALVSWVIDDAGANDATTGAPEGTLGVANLSGVPMAAWTSAETMKGGAIPAGTEITAVSPWSARRVPAGGYDAASGLAPASLSLEQALKGERVRLHAGDTTRTLTMYDARIPAIAPGVRVGPLQADWRLASWRSTTDDGPGPWGAARSPMDGAWTTTGLVYRGVDAPLGNEGSGPDRWLLYLEVGVAPTATEAREEDSVRVWLGPLGRPRMVLRVMRDGRVLDESPPGAEGSSGRDVPRLARTAATARGWSCWLGIPVTAVEAGGLLRLGVERTDPRGVRSCWPRAAMPWQAEPSRVAIDTAGWSDRPSSAPNGGGGGRGGGGGDRPARDAGDALGGAVRSGSGPSGK